MAAVPVLLMNASVVLERLWQCDSDVASSLCGGPGPYMTVPGRLTAVSILASPLLLLAPVSLILQWRSKAAQSTGSGL